MLEYLAPNVRMEEVSTGPPPIVRLSTGSADLLHELAQSIDEGTRWVVFEPNRESTWAVLRRQIADFLSDVWRGGTLVGSGEAEAFFIVCDRSTMTQDDIDNGTLVCVIGVALAEPAEFEIFRIVRKSGESVT
jgi:phage tail sheath protein FI